MAQINQPSHTKQDLMRLQGMSLAAKVEMTKDRIAQWLKYYDGKAFVSFSGGKDSTVLLDIARQVDANIETVYINTGLEVPEVRKFAMGFDNLTVLSPKMPFVRVIKKYGYPVISKEVAECVYGARKYLTQILSQQDNFNRQTDRQTDRTPVCLPIQETYRNWRICEAR